MGSHSLFDTGIFESHYSGRDLGRRASLQAWPCQKQPWTKMTLRRAHLEEMGPENAEAMDLTQATLLSRLRSSMVDTT